MEKPGVKLKLMLITGAVLGAMIVALLLAGNTVLLAGFQKAEDLAARGDAEKLLYAVDRELANIDILAGDWAIWDDTYQFMQDQNDDYIKANVSEVSLADLHLNLLVLADMDGRIILGRAFDLEQKTSASALKFIETHLSSNSPLRLWTNPTNALNGIEVCRRIITRHPRIKVIALSMHDDRRYVKKC